MRTFHASNCSVTVKANIDGCFQPNARDEDGRKRARKGAGCDYLVMLLLLKGF